MAWSTIDSFNAIASKVPGTSIDLTPLGLNPSNKVLQVGSVVVVCIAMDNIQTTDVEDGTDISSVTDDVGNTYIRAKTFTNGNGAAGAGTTCGIYYSVLEFTLTNGNVLTVTFNASITNKAITGGAVDLPPSGTLALVGSAVLANDAADPGPVTISGLDNIHSLLMIHALSLRGNSTNLYTEDADYTELDSALAPLVDSCIHSGYRFFTGTTDTVDTSLVTGVDCSQVYIAFQDPGFDLVLRNPGTNFDINLSAAAASTTIPYQPWLNRAPIQGQ